MAVVGIAKEMSEGRSSHDTESGTTYTRWYLVQTDNDHDGASIVKNAPGLPQRNQIYQTENATDANARVVDVNATQMPNTRRAWKAEVTYDTELEVSPFTNPIQELPEISIDFELQKEPIPGEIDQGISPGEIENGTVAWKSGIRNSAGEAYFPFPEHDVARPVVTYRRNESLFSMAVANQFVNSVNNSAWSGLGPRQAWLRGIRANSRTTTVDEQAFLFWDIEYTFALKREGWDLWVPDYGHYYLQYTTGGNINNPDSWSRVMFTTEGTGEPRLGLLDHGNSNQPGKRFDNEKTAQVQYNQYRIKKEQNFASLNIFLDLSLSQLRRPRAYVR